MSDDQFRYVRMKEYKPKLGQSAKSRTIRGADRDYRIKIDPETRQRPWHRVPLHIAKICEKTRVDPYREGSRLCMEVCTEEEARELDEAAEHARMAKKAREAPTVDDAIDHTRSDLSLADVRQGTSRSAAMTAATTPAGLPEEAKADTAPAGMQNEVADFIASSKAQIAEVIKSAGEATAASEAVIAKQDEKIAKLEKQLATAKKKAKKPAEKKPKKAGDEPPKRRGRPPKDKS